MMATPEKIHEDVEILYMLSLRCTYILIIENSICTFQTQSRIVYPWLSCDEGYLYDIQEDIPVYHPAQKPAVIHRGNDHNTHNVPEISPYSTGQNGILDEGKGCIPSIPVDNWDIYRKNHRRSLLDIFLCCYHDSFDHHACSPYHIGM
jgi:hypothetical protein